MRDNNLVKSKKVVAGEWTIARVKKFITPRVQRVPRSLLL